MTSSIASDKNSKTPLEKVDTLSDSEEYNILPSTSLVNINPNSAKFYEKNNNKLINNINIDNDNPQNIISCDIHENYKIDTKSIVYVDLKEEEDKEEEQEEKEQQKKGEKIKEIKEEQKEINESNQCDKIDLKEKQEKMNERDLNLLSNLFNMWGQKIKLHEEEKQQEQKFIKEGKEKQKNEDLNLLNDTFKIWAEKNRVVDEKKEELKSQEEFKEESVSLGTFIKEEIKKLFTRKPLLGLTFGIMISMMLMILTLLFICHFKYFIFFTMCINCVLCSAFNTFSMLVCFPFLEATVSGAEKATSKEAASVCLATIPEIALTPTELLPSKA